MKNFFNDVHGEKEKNILRGTTDIPTNGCNSSEYLSDERESYEMEKDKDYDRGTEDKSQLCILRKLLGLQIL